VLKEQCDEFLFGTAGAGTLKLDDVPEGHTGGAKH
jgi:hypothetical protein